MPYSPVKVNQHFGGMYYLHFQGQKESHARNQHEDSSGHCLLHAGFLLYLLLEAVHSSKMLVDFH
jgi:hypothetical protein